MSFFQWFSKKREAPESQLPDSSGLGPVDATLPFPGHPGHASATPKPMQPANAVNRKNERLERRELLYGTVRDCMTRVGVLSSSYKFKVLSLDAHGRHYLIMMDLPREHVSDTGRLAEIESLIARSAKAQHDILVTAVYWRVNEQVTAGMPRANARPTTSDAPLPVQPATVPAMTPPSAPPVTAAPAYEALQDEEVAAFKRALMANAPSGPAPKSGEAVQSGRRNPAPEPQFADTQIDDLPQPLGSTQYGELN